MLTEKVDREVMEAGRDLVVVSTMSVGVDHIDLKEATNRGIYVCNTPGVLTEATADHTFALLIAAARRLAEVDHFVRAGKWLMPWSPTMFLGASVYGKTLGIVGLGLIGQAVAERAHGFKMKVLYYKRHRLSSIEEKELGVEYREFDELLKESDFVSLHVPATEETSNLVGEKELKLMKPTAILVNTSRGTVVDEKALVKALKARWIQGAGIDVWAKEPTDPDNPLFKLDNTVLAPHIGSATIEARTKMSELSARNLAAVLKGEMPVSLVNQDVLQSRPLEEVK